MADALRCACSRRQCAASLSTPGCTPTARALVMPAKAGFVALDGGSWRLSIIAMVWRINSKNYSDNKTARQRRNIPKAPAQRAMHFNRRPDKLLRQLTRPHLFWIQHSSYKVIEAKETTEFSFASKACWYSKSCARSSGKAERKV